MHLKKINDLRRWPLIIFACAFSHQLISQTRPNILWIVCEDISPTLSMYGDSTANTPNLDALAGQSTIYKNAFSTVGVCGPSRSSIITGMYPTSIGTMHMRTGKDVMSHGTRIYADSAGRTDIKGFPIREYSAVIPEYVRCFTEYLRSVGYFCTNNQKTDYQFAAPLTAWDQNHKDAHWRNRPNSSTPFFSIFNFGDTHESMLWRNKDLPITIDIEKVPMPPYLIDDDITRRDVARHYSNIEILDQKIGNLIAQLKEDGLYENTIIFFYSDHGGPLPRQKREANDRGLKVPMMIKNIKQTHTEWENRLVSFVDLAPSILSLTNIPIPNYIQGQPFLGAQADVERSYIYGSGDRFDEFTDRVRIVRTKDYVYVRNLIPNLPSYQDLSYRKNIPSMNALLEQKSQSNLNAIQQSWFELKPFEELYQVSTDPHNVVNLSQKKEYKEILTVMSTLLDKHLKQHPDIASTHESKMIQQMWPDNVQPTTLTPKIKYKRGKIKLSQRTKGSSIAYLVSDQPLKELDRNAPWQLYIAPVKIHKGQYLNVTAERIGYQTSKIISIPCK